MCPLRPCLTYDWFQDAIGVRACRPSIVIQMASLHTRTGGTVPFARMAACVATHPASAALWQLHGDARRRASVPLVSLPRTSTHTCSLTHTKHGRLSEHSSVTSCNNIDTSLFRLFVFLLANLNCWCRSDRRLAAHSNWIVRRHTADEQGWE